jgi:hypothetical protein
MLIGANRKLGLRPRPRRVAAVWRIVVAVFFWTMFSHVSAIAQWWNPFAPTDYEECAESAARDARSKEALGILLSSCGLKFSGRRKPGGGYSYYDSRQYRYFDIEGPNPTPEEILFINKQYKNYLEWQWQTDEANRNEEKRRAEEAPQRAEEASRAEEAKRVAQQQQELDFEARRVTAESLVRIVSNGITCELSTMCGLYRLDVRISNQSTETISEVDFGWVFLSSQDFSCPSSFQTKHSARLTLKRSDTVMLNIHGTDGPTDRQSNYCVGITGIKILR